MKIFVLLNNYPSSGAPADSPLNAPEESPFWLNLPDSSILRTGNPFFIPDLERRYEAFPSVVYRIGRLGKSVSPRFAARYVDAFTFGFMVADTALLSSLRARSLPWSEAVAFDRSCIIGNFSDMNTFNLNESLCARCGEGSLQYSPASAKLGLEETVAFVSRGNTLKTGDLILAALSPCGVTLREGTKLTFGPDIVNKNYIDINIR